MYLDIPASDVEVGDIILPGNNRQILVDQIDGHTAKTVKIGGSLISGEYSYERGRYESLSTRHRYGTIISVYREG